MAGGLAEKRPHRRQGGARTAGPLSQPAHLRVRALSPRFTIGLGVVDDENNYADTNKVVAELGLPPALRMLYFADVSRDESEISWSHLGDVGVWLRAASGLRELKLQGGSMQLGAIDLPELQRFLSTGGFTAQNIRDVAQARWPKLESLSLYFGNDNYGGSGGVDDVRPILEGRAGQRCASWVCATASSPTSWQVCWARAPCCDSCASSISRRASSPTRAPARCWPARRPSRTWNAWT